MPAETERAWSILTSFEEFRWEAVGICLVEIPTVSNIEQAEGTYTLMMMSPCKPRQELPTIFSYREENGMG